MENKPKHTTGPWLYEIRRGPFSKKPIHGSVYSNPNGTGYICSCRPENAALIAAAPELLEAAKMVIDLLDCISKGTQTHEQAIITHRVLQAAIAKAEGK